MDEAEMRRGSSRPIPAFRSALKAVIDREAPSQAAFAAHARISNRIVGLLVLLMVTAVAVAVALGGVREVPLWVLGMIFTSLVLSELFPVRVGRIRYVGSDFAIWLAIVLVGPLPAVAMATTGVTIDAALRRVGLRMTIINVTIFAWAAAIGAVVFATMGEIGATVPGEAGLPISVLVLALTTDAVNLLILAIGAPTLIGLSIRDTFRQHWLPVVPWMTLTAALAAGTVHAYYTLGPGAVAVALLLHGAAQLLLKTIEREERQRSDVHAAFRARDRYLADALAAEARERRRVALELHDDALQHLLAARQELAAGDAARADDRIVTAVEVMRGLVTRQYELEVGPADLHHRLEELVGLITSQRGFRFTVDVAHDPGGATADLIVALARELVANATKHSRGTRVSVHVAHEEDLILLTVTDDGDGFELGSVNGRLRNGRLGLTVVEDRVTAQGGDLRVGAGPAGGASVRVRIPVGGGVPVREPDSL